MKKIYFIAIIAALILSAATYYMLPAILPKQGGVACYKDACFYAQSDPVEELKELYQKPSTIIYWEGDIEPTQTTAFLGQANTQLNKDLGTKEKVTAIAVSVNNSQLVGCYDCAVRENEQAWENCPEKTLEYCQGIEPNENEFMIKIKYPTYKENKIIIQNNVIEIQPKSGEDALAIVYLIKEITGV